MDLQTQEVRGYKYILTVVDLFSKMTWALPLKNKEGETVAKAFDKLLATLPKVSTVRSDRGSEFQAQPFKNVLKKHKVKQIFSLPYKPQSNGQVERQNKTLKRLINMTIKSTGDIDWVKQLPTITKNYNNAVNDTTDKTPNQIVAEDKEKNKQTKARIAKRVLKGRSKDTFKLNLGDKVRIKIDKAYQDRNRQLWSNEIYTIVKVLKPRNSVSSTRYKVNGKKEIFYNQDLQAVNIIDTKRDRKEKPLYVIKYLENPNVYKGKAYYWVKWIGYRDLSREPRKSLLEQVPKMLRRHENAIDVRWFPNAERPKKVKYRKYTKGKT